MKLQDYVLSENMSYYIKKMIDLKIWNSDVWLILACLCVSSGKYMAGCSLWVTIAARRTHRLNVCTFKPTCADGEILKRESSVHRVGRRYYPWCIALGQHCNCGPQPASALLSVNNHLFSAQKKTHTLLFHVWTTRCAFFFFPLFIFSGHLWMSMYV